jgi:hypothetical protein
VDTDAQFSITGQITRVLSGVANKGLGVGKGFTRSITEEEHQLMQEYLIMNQFQIFVMSCNQCF